MAQREGAGGARDIVEGSHLGSGSRNTVGGTTPWARAGAGDHPGWLIAPQETGPTALTLIELMGVSVRVLAKGPLTAAVLRWSFRFGAA